jgi:hypothetical protein
MVTLVISPVAMTAMPSTMTEAGCQISEARAVILT